MTAATRFTAAQQVLNAFGGQFPATQGRIIFCRPGTGGDGRDGSTPQKAVKTLTQALALATANQNDIVVLMAESNTASATTDYQLDNLNWNKDGVHLIGINAGARHSPRSRVAMISSWTAAHELFTLSANGCLIQGIEFFAGVASVNPLGCMSVTGDRNVIRRCHIAGMGNSANDIAGAYSLNLSAAEENLFDDCVIGQDTVQLGANSNSVLLFSNSAPANTRNHFRKCIFELFTSHASNCLFARGGGVGNLDREQIFEDCLFLNAIDSSSTNLTHAMAIVTGGGLILLTGNTGVVGATGWNATNSILRAAGGALPLVTFGTSVQITG